MKQNKDEYSGDFIEYLSRLGAVRQNEPLKNYTTLNTGGPADILIYPDNRKSISKIVKLARDEDVPLTTVGAGSNLLVGDRGIRGIVLRICENGIIKGIMRNNGIPGHDEGMLYADASVKKGDFIDYSLNEGYEGAEFMAGIPGCIGGGIVMNAGTDMGSFINILDRVDIVDGEGSYQTLKADKDMFSYRKSNINKDAVVVGGYFRLPVLKNIKKIKKRIEDILDERNRKHPLSFPSAGSVFKNPEGNSSWKMIDDAGLKGKKIGGAMISDLHTNFIVNIDNAASKDIRDLIEFIQHEVYLKFSITLETEIRIIGEF